MVECVLAEIIVKWCANPLTKGYCTQRTQSHVVPLPISINNEHSLEKLHLNILSLLSLQVDEIRKDAEMGKFDFGPDIQSVNTRKHRSVG